MYNDKDIKDGFEAAGKRMGDFDVNMDEIKKHIESLARQLKSYGRLLRSSALDEDGYSGFWPSEEMARGFGCIVAKAAGLNVETKDMGTGSNAAGGFLVPEELSSWIIQKLGKYGKFRANAMPVKLGANRQLVPKVSADLVVYCPGEGKEITKSDIDFSAVGLEAKKFCCLTVVNSELNDDAIVGLGEIVGLSITRSMAKKEDLIGFMGDGSATYFAMTGIVGALLAVDDAIANIKSLVVASGNAYSEITLGDFRKVVGILPDDADEDAKWYMNKKFYYNVVYPLAETAGVANIFEILSDRKGRFLLGYPVEFVSCMASVEANSQICAILGDLKLGAFLGERKTLEIAISKEVYFASDQIGIRGIERVSVSVYGVGDTEEAGAIVGLITAES